MLTVDEQQTYQGLIITRHHIVDSVSKEKAKNPTGWEKVELTAPDWIHALENGHTIQPSDYIPKLTELTPIAGKEVFGNRHTLSARTETIS